MASIKWNYDEFNAIRKSTGVENAVKERAKSIADAANSASNTDFYRVQSHPSKKRCRYDIANNVAPGMERKHGYLKGAL